MILVPTVRSTFRLVALASLAAIVSLTPRRAQQPQPPPAQASPPAEAPPRQQPTAPGTLKRAPMRLALPRREYACSGGVQITTLIEDHAVRLFLNGQPYSLADVQGSNAKPEKQSAKTAKYSDGAKVWSLKGDTGILQDLTDPAHPKTLAKRCHLKGAYPPEESAGPAPSKN